MEEILDVIHKTIYQFFDVCDDDEEVPVSEKDKLLLKVNKAICNNLKALDQIKTGHWIATGNYFEGKYGYLDYFRCSCCHKNSLEKGRYCPNCKVKMI